MRYIAEDATLRFKFTTRRFSTGAPYTLAGTPSLEVYPEDSLTQINTGITLTADYDSVTGLNQVVIDLSASASYAAGKAYQVVIAAGTVDSVSVVGEVIYEFYIHASGGMEAFITRGLLALPAAAADAAGGLPVSDAGGLDLDAKLAATNEVTAARMGALTDWLDGGRLDLLLDAIKAKTDNLPTDPADASDIAAEFAALNDLDAAAVRAAIGMAAADLDTQLGTLATAASITALNDLDAAAVRAALGLAAANLDTQLGDIDTAANAAATPAEVNTEMVDVLSTDTQTAPTGVPSAAPTLAAAIMWVFTLARNKQTFNKSTGVHQLRNDSDSGNIATSTATDDGTTITRPEWGA